MNAETATTTGMARGARLVVVLDGGGHGDDAARVAHLLEPWGAQLTERSGGVALPRGLSVRCLRREHTLHESGGVMRVAERLRAGGLEVAEQSGGGHPYEGPLRGTSPAREASNVHVLPREAEECLGPASLRISDVAKNGRPQGRHPRTPRTESSKESHPVLSLPPFRKMHAPSASGGV